MKFIIYKVKNGYLLNISYSKEKTESFIFTNKERMTMLARIDALLGPEPEDAIGMTYNIRDSLNKDKA